MRCKLAVAFLPLLISGCFAGLPRLQLVMPEREGGAAPEAAQVQSEPPPLASSERPADDSQLEEGVPLRERLSKLMPSKETALKGAAIAGGAYMAYRINKSDANNPVIPNQTLNLGATTSIALEKLVAWGAFVGTAYLILDPFAPNWEIEEAQFPEQHYHMALKMRRLYSGGAGDAQQVFRLRAQELMRRNGYKAYDVVEYTESLDSSILGSQRLARGVIKLRDPS